MIRACRSAFSGQLMVMVRPRGGGDFVYSDAEVQVMLEDIRTAKACGVDGVVFGALRPDGTVDATITGRLWGLANELGLDATFHRAFDMTPDPIAALDSLMMLGLPRVLTSGGAPSAIEGADTLAALVRRGHGRITVLAGGGVTPGNTGELVRRCGLQELHSTAKRVERSQVLYRRPGMSMVSARPPQDWEWPVADALLVRRLVEAAAEAAAEEPGVSGGVTVASRRE
ncbi:hypothetical protein CHLRE_17g732700v5 [Chlamydomonas reinhardtii]|uniref:Copper homeostasis protein cutC homolog n=1 Tax=Chlamydomonas reinhardtii TaxID=3055 RepID=A0A2K3CR36_CHLRE|nr:uncharacterized protein CHLRE_17g732700v5 [Chlamydomonas reinhardtii]PNW70742.1 hypothetical protein CHLRE_17g732700v5 [Chlamydomonas reinhardtii]